MKIIISKLLYRKFYWLINPDGGIWAHHWTEMYRVRSICMFIWRHGLQRPLAVDRSVPWVGKGPAFSQELSWPSMGQGHWLPRVVLPARQGTFSWVCGHEAYAEFMAAPTIARALGQCKAWTSRPRSGRLQVCPGILLMLAEDLSPPGTLRPSARQTPHCRGLPSHQQVQRETVCCAMPEGHEQRVCLAFFSNTLGV